VIPFELINVGATYQWLMEKILQPMINKNVLAYFDDMVVRSRDLANHKKDLQEFFTTINKISI